MNVLSTFQLSILAETNERKTMIENMNKKIKEKETEIIELNIIINKSMIHYDTIKIENNVLINKKKEENENCNGKNEIMRLLNIEYEDIKNKVKDMENIFIQEKTKVSDDFIFLLNSSEMKNKQLEEDIIRFVLLFLCYFAYFYCFYFFLLLLLLLS